MRMVEVVGRCVTIRAGQLLLTPEQASARQHAIRRSGEGNVYDVLLPTHFIQGEHFGYDGPPLSDAIQMHLHEEDEVELEISARDLALSEINPDEDVPVSLIKDALGLNTLKEAYELLGEKYGVKVSKGTHVVPPEIFAQIAEDYGFEFDDTLDNA